jgi:plastocyanin
MARVVTAAIGAVLAAALASTPAHAVRYIIPIRNMAYGPAPALLRVGDTLLWRNEDMFRHTVTARSGEFDLDLMPGKEKEVQLGKSGKLNIYCRYHPTMTLSLYVKPVTRRTP